MASVSLHDSPKAFQSSTMLALSVLTAVASLITTASAHGGVISMSVGSTKYTGWAPFNTPAGQVSAERPYSSFNPITNPSDATMS